MLFAGSSVVQRIDACRAPGTAWPSSIAGGRPSPSQRRKSGNILRFDTPTKFMVSRQNSGTAEDGAQAAAEHRRQ